MVDHRRVLEVLHCADVEAMEIAERQRKDWGLRVMPDPVQVMEDAEKLILAIADMLENDSPS